MSVSIKLEKRKIAIIAGEVSGDKIGSDLINEIKSSFDIELCGIGGQELKKQGLKSLFPYDELSIIGIWGIVKNIFTLKNRVDSTVDTINKFNPELLIIIDCPEFTHRVAKKVKKMMPHLVIINYISPTIWFWRQGRARKMNKYISHILSIFPFEPALYDKLNGPPCTYIGNPLFENIISNKLDNTKVARSKKSILFMPGSRKTEIEKLLPPCAAAFKEIKKLKFLYILFYLIKYGALIIVSIITITHYILNPNLYHKPFWSVTDLLIIILLIGMIGLKPIGLGFPATFSFELGLLYFANKLWVPQLPYLFIKKQIQI